MTMVGTVESLWRFPVKSMRGEQLREAAVTERCVLGDRAYALIDTDTGRVVSAKSARLFPEILNCGANFVRSPQSGDDIPPVHIALPDGRPYEATPPRLIVRSQRISSAMSH